MPVSGRPDFWRWVYFALLLFLSSGRCIGHFQHRLDGQAFADARVFSLRSCRRVCRRVESRRAEAEIDLLGVFAKPCLVLRTFRNDHDVAGAADPLFASKTELHLALQHPRDLLICVTVRLDMHAGPDAPPYDHPLVAGESAAADLFADLLLKLKRRTGRSPPVSA